MSNSLINNKLARFRMLLCVVGLRIYLKQKYKHNSLVEETNKQTNKQIDWI